MSNVIFGLGVALIGMLIVFFGLIVLICCVKGMNFLFGRTRKSPKTPAPMPAPVAPVTVQPDPEPAQDDSLIAAVIAAAIAAVWQEDTGFVVRRIRRVNNASSWQKAGREEQIYSRL